MRLCAIFNVWFDSVELLPYSLNCLVNQVDEIIIVRQTVSNFGERIDYELFSEDFLEKTFSGTIFTFVEFTPSLKLSGMRNETNKRNLGLEVARSSGCSHFLNIDSDELFENFGSAKKAYFDSGHAGSVSKMFTYFKKPTLRFENPDNYYVPFIHELKPDTVLGKSGYPFYVDPTRRVNEADVIELPHLMHHMSYVRKDISLKVRNSSARENILKSKLMRDYHDPNVGEGFYVADFKQKLVETPNIFNIEI